MGDGLISLLEIEFIDGEEFGPYNSENKYFIFNESAAEKYNLKVGDYAFGGFPVRGIVKDFSAHSMHKTIEPMAIMQQSPKNMRLLAIKTTGEDNEHVIAEVEKLFCQISPDKTPEVYPLTEQISQFYSHEVNQQKLLHVFVVLTLFMTIIGLLGVVLNTLKGKTKEIGIRKVNGANLYDLVYLFNLDFVKWVIFAFIVACPIAFYGMTLWLENFAYKTELSWWVFVLAGIFALVIALLTVSWQTFRAVRRNPVEALKYE